MIFYHSRKYHHIDKFIESCYDFEETDVRYDIRSKKMLWMEYTDDEHIEFLERIRALNENGFVVLKKTDKCIYFKYISPNKPKTRSKSLIGSRSFGAITSTITNSPLSPRRRNSDHYVDYTSLWKYVSR